MDITSLSLRMHLLESGERAMTGMFLFMVRPPQLSCLDKRTCCFTRWTTKARRVRGRKFSGIWRKCLSYPRSVLNFLCVAFTSFDLVSRRCGEDIASAMSQMVILEFGSLTWFHVVVEWTLYARFYGSFFWIVERELSVTSVFFMVKLPHLICLDDNICYFTRWTTNAFRFYGMISLLLFVPLPNSEVFEFTYFDLVSRLCCMLSFVCGL